MNAAEIATKCPWCGSDRDKSRPSSDIFIWFDCGTSVGKQEGDPLQSWTCKGLAALVEEDKCTP
jgi:hypothetical protein